jgi:hypothetical protein
MYVVPKMKPAGVPSGPVTRIRKHYKCSHDGTTWYDDSTRLSIDSCPICEANTEPYSTEELKEFKAAS